MKINLVIISVCLHFRVYVTLPNSDESGCLKYDPSVFIKTSSRSFNWVNNNFYGISLWVHSPPRRSGLVGPMVQICLAAMVASTSHSARRVPSGFQIRMFRKSGHQNQSRNYSTNILWYTHWTSSHKLLQIFGYGLCGSENSRCL